MADLMVSVHSSSPPAAGGPPSVETETLKVASEGEARGADTAGSPSDSSKKYHVLMELGRGGAGIVSAAIARGIGGFSKLVVLKTTKPELDSPETIKLLLNEARLSARMSHPNIVQVYEVYQDAGVPVIVMEYLDGLSLAKLLSRALRDPAYTVEIGLTILCKVLEGLEYAHTLTDFGGRPLGIVHRDVTPQNVMVTYDGQVKLLDFGIAKLNLQTNGAHTGSVKGKLCYMSPEQLAGMPLDARSDVFAVGVMLWEVVARRRMWASHGEADIMRRLLSDDVPALREMVPDVDAELERICSRALSPRTRARHESAKALLLELQAYLARRGSAASAAAIVDLMERTCADLRASAQGRLEHELAKFSHSTDEDWSNAATADLTRSLAQSAQHDRKTRTTTPATPLGRKGDTGSASGIELQDLNGGTSRRPRHSVSRWLAAALVLGVTGWGVAGGVTWREAKPLASGPASTEVLTPGIDEGRSDRAQHAAARQAEAVEVRITVSAEPAGARIFIDDQRVENPYRASRPRDGKEHELRVEAEGHVPVVRSLRLDADVELVLALKAEPASAPAPRDRARRTPKTPRQKAAGAANTQAPAPARARAKNCDPPYYFDENGIKHFLRECLSN